MNGKSKSGIQAAGAEGAARSTAGKATARKSGANDSKTNKAISPLEHWRMVAEAAYYRAEKRGFFGGNPLEDWSEAEKEIDAEYTVNYGKMLTTLNPSEAMDQFSKALSRIHFPGVHLEAVMDAQRKNVQALSDANQVVFEGARNLTKRQMEIFQETVDEAAAAIREIKALPSAKDLPVKQAKLLKEAIEKALANMAELAEMTTRSRKEAIEIVKARTSESIDEIKQFAQKMKG